MADDTKQMLQETRWSKGNLTIVVENAMLLTDPKFWALIDPRLSSRIAQAIEGADEAARKLAIETHVKALRELGVDVEL